MLARSDRQVGRGRAAVKLRSLHAVLGRLDMADQFIVGGSEDVSRDSWRRVVQTMRGLEENPLRMKLLALTLGRASWSSGGVSCN